MTPASYREMGLVRVPSRTLISYLRTFSNGGQRDLPAPSTRKWTPHSNGLWRPTEVFLRASPTTLATLARREFEFHMGPGHDNLARLVWSFATGDTIDALVAALHGRGD
jgi:hypothetical protein